MVVLKREGHRCQSCGATPNDTTVGGAKVRLVVDHIIPISRRWDLRLDPTNLQVLCDECNMGKGNWDVTDYRAA
jgi:5-methylcytosine-specific restriction endonuclease McrA